MNPSVTDTISPKKLREIKLEGRNDFRGIAVVSDVHLVIRPKKWGECFVALTVNGNMSIRGKSGDYLNLNHSRTEGDLSIDVEVEGGDLYLMQVVVGGNLYLNGSRARHIHLEGASVEGRVFCNNEFLRSLCVEHFGKDRVVRDGRVPSPTSKPRSNHNLSRPNRAPRLS